MPFMGFEFASHQTIVLIIIGALEDEKSHMHFHISFNLAMREKVLQVICLDL